MNSIRNRILVYLVPTLILVYLLTGWRILKVTSHEAEEVLDAELANFARLVINSTTQELSKRVDPRPFADVTTPPVISPEIFPKSIGRRWEAGRGSQVRDQTRVSDLGIGRLPRLSKRLLPKDASLARSQWIFRRKF